MHTHTYWYIHTLTYKYTTHTNTDIYYASCRYTHYLHFSYVHSYLGPMRWPKEINTSVSKII